MAALGIAALIKYLKELTAVRRYRVLPADVRMDRIFAGAVILTLARPRGKTCQISRGRAIRWSAFDNAGLAEPLRTLIEKVASHAHKVTDEDITAARASGLSEDQIFEIVVCASVGQAARQYDTALAALTAATDLQRGRLATAS